MANYPTVAAFPDETGDVGIRAGYFHPVTTTWIEIQTSMIYVGTVDLTNSAPFHGSPTSGTQKIALYSFDWVQPLDGGGDPFTNAIWVYYCPYFRILDTNTGTELDRIWVLQQGIISNNYEVNPQHFDSWFTNKDYGYNNQWTWDQDGDWIADLWEIRYFGEITNCQAGANDDGDTRNNGEEYVADSVPTNGESYFRDLIKRANGNEIKQIRVESPTTNSRLYDIFWKTNLMTDESWAPFGLDQLGQISGTNLWLTVTNTQGRMFYRTGVKVQNPW